MASQTFDAEHGIILKPADVSDLVLHGSHWPVAGAARMAYETGSHGRRQGLPAPSPARGQTVRRKL